MAKIEDPVDKLDREINDLRQKLRDKKTEKAKIEATRGLYPKIVFISAGRGKWDESVMEVFARECGWTADKHPNPDFGYVNSQSGFYLEVHADGQMRLVGAWMQGFGKIGHTDPDSLPDPDLTFKLPPVPRKSDD